MNTTTVLPIAALHGRAVAKHTILKGDPPGVQSYADTSSCREKISDPPKIQPEAMAITSFHPFQANCEVEKLSIHHHPRSE